MSVTENMSAFEAHNDGGQSETLNSASQSRRAKRKTTCEIFFDEEPVFSDSDEEQEFHRFTLSTASSLKMTIGEKSRSSNKESYQLSHLEMDQLLMLCCKHCACCKKIKDFLELLPTKELTTQDLSTSSHDSGLGSASSHNGAKRFKKANTSKKNSIISCQNFSTSKSSWQVDILDRYCNLSIPNLVENGSLSDSLHENPTFEQNCTVRDTMPDVWKTTDQITQTTDILPKVQNDNISSKKLENNTNEDIKENVNQRNKVSLQRRTGRPKKDQNININKKSWKDDSNDLPENIGNSDGAEINLLLANGNLSLPNSPSEDCTTTKILQRKSLKQHKPIQKLAETDPYKLKNETSSKLRSTRSNTGKYFRTRPLFKVSVDTTSNRNFSNAIARKLGRTGGVCFDMNSINMNNGRRETFHTQKKKTLYSSDEWLNSKPFLQLSGDEY